jgi:hypothetical protein
MMLSVESRSDARSEPQIYGYRDWKLISVAREVGSLNDIRAILGNDVAIRAYHRILIMPFAPLTGRNVMVQY